MTTIHYEKLNEIIDYFGKQLTSVQKNFYIKSIEKYANSQKVLNAAIDMLIESERFFPTPSKIKEAYFLAKNLEWYKVKDAAIKDKTTLADYAAVENPYAEALKLAAKNYRENKTPFNQTYFDLGLVDLIDDESSPPIDMSFKYTGISLEENSRVFKVNALCAADGEVLKIIRPLEMSEIGFEKMLYRFSNIAKIA